MYRLLAIVTESHMNCVRLFDDMLGRDPYIRSAWGATLQKCCHLRCFVNLLFRPT